MSSIKRQGRALGNASRLDFDLGKPSLDEAFRLPITLRITIEGDDGEASASAVLGGPRVTRVPPLRNAERIPAA